MKPQDLLPHGPLIEALLGGAFICDISNETFFRQLQNEGTQRAIDEYLAPLNRRVVWNASGSAAWLGWCHVTPPLRDALAAHLGEVYRSLLPLLDWLLLVQEAGGSDSVLAPGDILRQSELMQRCEDNPSLRERLQRIAADRFFNSASDDVGKQIQQIFRRLLDNGYVMQPNREQQIYRATGKIDYLIDLVRFLKDEEGLPIAAPEETEAVQEPLLP